METKHSWRVKGVVWKEREKVDFGAATKFADLQAEG